jgi:hypothetical protein
MAMTKTTKIAMAIAMIIAMGIAFATGTMDCDDSKIIGGRGANLLPEELRAKQVDKL